MSESSPDHASGQASGATSAPASSQTWGSGKDSGTLLFAGNQCPARPKATPQGSQPEGDPNNGGIISGACLSLIAPGWLLENLVREGSYLVSPGWLADWKKNVAVWGFDTTGLREFVQGSIKQVCLLDTLTLADSERRLAEFSKALGLPALRIPVGMAYCSEVLQSIISPKPAEPRPGADYAMALDLISRLGQFQDENQVISQLLEILSMLFAPGSLFLIRYEDGSPAGLYHTFSEEQVVDEATAAACSAFSRSTSPSEHEDGFVLPIDFDNQRMALVFMTSLAMPESRDSYLNLIESIVPIFSMSLNNARNYEALVRNETALQDKQKELLDTLEFRDRLLAIIGHDLRGPIGSMGDLLQVLGESLEGSIPEREKNFLSEIILAAQSASALLLNLLEWAKLQTSAVVLTPEVLLAKDEVAEIFSIMQSQAALKEITLRNEADPGFRVYADRNIMQTILRNLVSNALKYTQPGGSVTVRTHQSNGNHNMDIVDTGTGMDKETLANALDFSRRRSMAGTKGERGSGLGLVFCKELAEKSGATLAMESAPGKGTKVSLIFTQPA
jgi:signal transduction histidine kinase